MKDPEIIYRNCNLQENYNLIFTKNRPCKTYYFLMKSEFKTAEYVEIDKLLDLIPIATFNFPNEPKEHQKPYLNAVRKYLSNVSTKEQVFLAKLSIAQVDQVLGAVFQPEIIFGDITNILMLSIRQSTKSMLLLFLEDIFSPIWEIEKRRGRINQRLSDIFSNNLKACCTLKPGQFSLIQKSLGYIRKSLFLGNYDRAFSLVALISAIEPLAEKYSDMIVDKQMPKSPYFSSISKKVKKFLKDEKATELTRDIDALLLKNEYFKVKNKFVNFCHFFCGNDFRNSKLNEMLDDVYFLRNSILHGADDSWNITLDNGPTRFNKFTRTGKMKTEEGALRRVPNLMALVDFFSSIIVNFINYLKKEKPDDDELYTDYDMKERHEVMATIKGPYRPGTVLFDKDIKREFDFLDAVWIARSMNNISEEVPLDKLEAALADFMKNFEQIPINTRIEEWIEAIELIFVAKCRLKKFDEIINDINKYHLVDSNPKHWLAFNTLCYGYLEKDNFFKAHEQIDKLLVVQQEINIKSILYDTKGDIFKKEDKNDDALHLFIKSLDIISDGKYLPFHKDTIDKILTIANLKGDQTLIQKYTRFRRDIFPDK